MDIECALGYYVTAATPVATYENVVIFAKSVKVIGYHEFGGVKDSTGKFVEQSKLETWPEGVSFVVSEAQN